MSRPKKVAPDYRYHVSGQAVVTFNGTNFYLGPHNSPKSQAKYRKLLAEYISSGGATPNDETHHTDTPVTVADIAAEARAWIKTKFANNEAQLCRFNNLCTTLVDEYGDTPANEFGPRKLSELRDLFVASGNSRRYTNTQTRNVVRIFRYALSRELIDASVIVRLDSIEPLQLGQTSAHEPAPVEPVDLNHVRATAAILSPTLKAMVRIQAATGKRVARSAKKLEKDTMAIFGKEFRSSLNSVRESDRDEALVLVEEAQQAISDCRVQLITTEEELAATLKSLMSKIRGTRPTKAKTTKPVPLRLLADDDVSSVEPEVNPKRKRVRRRAKPTVDSQELVLA